MTAGNLKHVSRVLLGFAVVAFLVWAMSVDVGVLYPLMSGRRVAHFAGFYVLTLLAFLAFPKMRRADIIYITTLSSVLVEATRHLLRQQCDAFDFISDILGVQAVSFPSHAEHFRMLIRTNPWAKLSSASRRRGNVFHGANFSSGFPKEKLGSESGMSPS